jgi:NAD(P)-dependent dehydrogenase (short-subunit alcohol dehydrogenase family)
MPAFDNKVVILTGGALGIGRACALAFAREGARVTIADINATAGQEAVQAIEAIRPGNIAHLVVADLSLASDCRRVVQETVERFGGVDVLFNNVGIQPLDSYQRAEDTTEEQWDRILNVNLKSYFLMSKYALPEIRKRGGGAVINTASVQGLQSAPRVPAYAASKGGVLSLTRQLALDYAVDNIRVLAVCPGTIDTEMVRTAARLEPDGTEAALVRFGKSHPLGRIGTGQDIANVVLFLASDAASFMTGEYVCVDGGYMALGAWASGAADAR